MASKSTSGPSGSVCCLEGVGKSVPSRWYGKFGVLWQE